MREPVILALDQGTTSCRAICFDRQGRVASLAQREFPQHYPRPGWVEHDPQEIWETQLTVAREALQQGAIPPASVAALGVTNQRETVLFWDRSTGRPLTPAIVWQCRRTADMCARLKAAGHEAAIRGKTGLVLDAYFSGTKVAWLLEHTPGLRERARRGDACAGTIDSWLIFRLTGGAAHVTDPTNASRTMLFNLHSRQWDDDLLALLEVPRRALPAVRPSSEVYGRTPRDLLGAEIPVAGAAGDQQAALFGQACFGPGLAKNTYGTGSFLLVHTGEKPATSTRGLLTTMAATVGETPAYALEGSIFVTGAAVQWLRDGLRLIDASAESEHYAAQVPDTGGVYFVPAFVGLGAPHWDPYARGAILGLTRGTTRAHVVRAALEAIAYQSREVVEAAEGDAGIRMAELKVDGGAARNDFLMQFQADILDRPVIRPKVTETTALGAAYLAGLAVGYWAGLEEIGENWGVERRFEPKMAAGEREALYAGWRRAVTRAAGWAAPG
ncbi:MAG TPA: glycerol kinase GlpK [Candidatus Methylomirabilis sp.]|nr:glycerol kinase GlpK [Candidatus Methylomirabilis sp.]